MKRGACCLPPFSHTVWASDPVEHLVFFGGSGLRLLLLWGSPPKHHEIAEKNKNHDHSYLLGSACMKHDVGKSQ